MVEQVRAATPALQEKDGPPPKARCDGRGPGPSMTAVRALTPAPARPAFGLSPGAGTGSLCP